MSASVWNRFTCGVTTSGAGYCWATGWLGDGKLSAGTPTPVAVAGGLTFAMVSAGNFHACGVTISGVAYCWGENFSGQIGTGTFLAPTEIRYLRSCGHVIGSHSRTHPDIFRDLPRERMLEEWRVSAEVLSALLGDLCLAASVPGGDISPLVLQSADAAQLRYLFTCEPELVPRRLGECWVLGRFLPKLATAPDRVEELAGFRGWSRALMVRRAKVLACWSLPPLYRWYVRMRTRAWPRA